MQNMIVGAPGSGKSYEAVVFHILPSLSAGRMVITNMPLNLDVFSKIDSAYQSLITLVSFKEVGHFGSLWRHPDSGSGPLYVIDEAHKILAAESTPRPVLEWFAEHRHESADILLITQGVRKIHRHILENTQVVYRVRKNISFGSSSSYVRKVQDGYRGEVFNTSVRRYEKKYFPLYQSYTKGGGKELEVKDVKSIWHHWAFYCFLACFVYLIFNWKNPLSLFNSSSHSPVPASSDVVRSAQLNAGSPNSVVKESDKSSSLQREPFEFIHVHVVGFVRGLSGKYVYALLLSRDLLPLRVISSEDFTLAGYEIEALSDCVMRYQYPGGQKRFAVCDSPVTAFNRDSSVRREPLGVEDRAGGTRASGGDPPRSSTAVSLSRRF